MKCFPNVNTKYLHPDKEDWYYSNLILISLVNLSTEQAVQKVGSSFWLSEFW